MVKSYYRSDREDVPVEHRNVLNEFLSSLKVANLSPETIYHYRLFLERFLRDTTIPLKDLTYDDVWTWLQTNCHGLKATTLNRRISRLSVFFKFCKDVGTMERVLIKRYWRPRNPKPIPKFLSKPDLAHVRLAAEKLPLMERVMVEFFLSTGCRRSELFYLNVRDVDVLNRTAKVQGKGRKERSVYFSQTCAILLNDYLPTLSTDNPALFLSKKGRLCRSEIFKTIQKLGVAAKLSRRLSPHCLRHTFATTLLSKGADIDIIKHFLGHNDVNTTRIYANLLPENITRLYRQCMG